MDRIQLAPDLSFSRFIHGFWRAAEWKMSDQERLTFIEECREQGISTFDHADIYGSYTCESLFGEALRLQPTIRDQIEIVTKCGIVLPSSNRPNHTSHYYNTSYEHIIQSCETSLKNLHTDYIDVLLIHRPDLFMNPEEVAEAFTKLKREGKVRYFGVSNFKFHQFQLLQSYLDFDLVTNQIEISAYELENIHDGTLNFCQEKRIPPMAWSPLAGGKIFKGSDEKVCRLRMALEEVQGEINAHSIDEVLYAWLLSHSAKIMPIIGSGKIDRIKTAVQSLSYKLTPEQWYNIYTSSTGYDVP